MGELNVIDFLKQFDKKTDWNKRIFNYRKKQSGKFAIINNIIYGDVGHMIEYVKNSRINNAKKNEMLIKLFEIKIDEQKKVINNFKCEDILEKDMLTIYDFKTWDELYNRFCLQIENCKIDEVYEVIDDFKGAIYSLNKYTTMKKNLHNLIGKIKDNLKIKNEIKEKAIELLKLPVRVENYYNDNLKNREKLSDLTKLPKLSIKEYFKNIEFLEDCIDNLQKYTKQEKITILTLYAALKLGRRTTEIPHGIYRKIDNLIIGFTGQLKSKKSTIEFKIHSIGKNANEVINAIETLKDELGREFIKRHGTDETISAKIFNCFNKVEGRGNMKTNLQKFLFVKNLYSVQDIRAAHAMVAEELYNRTKDGKEIKEKRFFMGDEKGHSNVESIEFYINYFIVNDLEK